MTTIDERVAAGAAWLDEHHPGWANGIDLDAFHVADPCGCVWGQLEGEYALRDRGMAGRERELGFDVHPAPQGATIAEVDAEYEDLTAAWRHLILERRDRDPHCPCGDDVADLVGASIVTVKTGDVL